MSRGVMAFHPVKDCWVVELNNESYDLRCGECSDLIIGSRRLPCRLELGLTWYVILESASLDLRTCETYQICI